MFTNTINRIGLILIVFIAISNNYAGAVEDSRNNDSISINPKVSLYDKIMKYLDESNTANSNDHFSIIGGPHYNSDTKLGLGIVGSGFFKFKGCNDGMQPSNATIVADFSTSGYCMAGIRSNLFMPHDNMRVNYSFSFEYCPTYFWGIGYDKCDNDNNKTRMRYRDFRMKCEFLARLASNLYIGPSINWDYVSTDSIDRVDLLKGQDMTVRNYGIGLVLEYDTRDLITNASSGIYIHLGQLFRPKGLWNKYYFSTTDFHACSYHRVWNGGIIAGEIVAVLNYGKPSWGVMSLLGDSYSMRGYYHGRYRDKCMTSAQVELRQHLWNRFGCVLWTGGGNVFHDIDSFHHFLPNFGAGLRWEFRHRVNIRLDYGLGKSGQNGFIFNINEAF